MALIVDFWYAAPMGFLTVEAGSERQEAFLRALIAGAEPTEAARRAGYRSPDASASHLLRSPRVLDALAAAVHRYLVAEASPLAIGFLVRVLREDKFPAGARVDAAKTLLDRAGIVARKEALSPAEKDLAELSTDELHARIEGLERELGDRAKASLPANPSDSEAQLAEFIGELPPD